MALLHLSRQPASTTTGWRYWLCSCNSGRPIKLIRPSTFLLQPPRVHHGAFKQLSVNKENFVSSSSDSGSGNGCASYVHVPSSFLAAEKVEVEAMLSLFLAKQGLSNALTSDRFINHLLWKLHSLQKSRYLEQGREQLTSFEIQETLIPYLESLLVENGDIIYNLFPKLSISPSSTELLSMKIKRKQKNNKLLKAVARVCEKDSEGDLLPQVLYLIEIGMELNQIKDITRKFPPFAFYNLDRKIKPTIKFLLGLGISQADIPSILRKRPQLFGISLSNLLSESEWRAIGVQQSRGWVHYAIHRPEPHIMLYRRPLNYQQNQERPPLLQVSRCLPNDFHFSRVWLVTLWLLVYIRIAYWVVFSHG